MFLSNCLINRSAVSWTLDSIKAVSRKEISKGTVIYLFRCFSMTNILHLQSSFVFNKFPSHSLKVQISMAASSEKQINGFSSIRVRQKSWGGLFVCTMGTPSPGRQECRQPERDLTVAELSNKEMGISGANSASFYEPGSPPICSSKTPQHC